MDAKAMVLERHTQAEARYQAPVPGEGVRPTQPGYWVISPSKGAGTSILGRGASEAEAWHRAAALIHSQAD